MCQAMNYALVALHLKIQTAAAYERLERYEEAGEFLKQAIGEAKPDQFFLPFAENYRYLKELLRDADRKDRSFVERIVQTGEVLERQLEKEQNQKTRPSRFAVLTEREYEIAGLAAMRLSNREIAEKLFLSEGSVKQYINQIYSKLGIEGDVRTKRGQLQILVKENP